MSTAREQADDTPDSRGTRWWLWALIALAALVLLIAGGVSWLLGTESGARWAARTAVDVLGGRLEIRTVQGTLAGPLTLQGVRYLDDDRGVDARVANVTIDVELLQALRRRVHVRTLQVSGTDVRLSTREKQEKKEEPPRRHSLEPPIDFVLDELALQDARVSRDGKELFVARTAGAAGSWTRGGIVIRRLDVLSPDGSLQLTGNLQDRRTYVGRMNGAFRWRVGERQYAGELTAIAEDAQVKAQLRTSAPFDANLDATLSQTDALPWELTLTVPPFDARKALLPNGAIERLGATLTGRGDRTLAEVRGRVAINGQDLRIEPLRARWQEQTVTLEQLVLIDPSGGGTLTGLGEVRFGEAARAAARVPVRSVIRERGDAPPTEQGAVSEAGTGDARSSERHARAQPAQDAPADAPAAPADDESAEPSFFADLSVSWKDVQLPQEWVGQPLATHGGVKLTGTMANFIADGQLSLGPPGRLSDIAFGIEGTPERIDIHRISVTDPVGVLTTHGIVRLKPQIGWQLEARASRFDPGKFVVGWSGQLGFDLRTEGSLTPQGPNVSLDMRNLQGQLRGRSLAGQAALTLNPARVLAGSARLRSGRSELRVDGRGETAMDLDARIDVRALDDWIPNASGSVNGHFHIAGTWPGLRINGGARGSNLSWGEYSVKALQVNADVSNPQSPSGSLTVTATDIMAAGFAFSDTRLEASGEQSAHSLQLSAKGEPLSAELSLHGSREGEGWSGSVDRLTLAVMGLEPVSLREPALVSWSPNAFSVSESCLTGDQLSACAAAARSESGELSASYRLERLPLGLVLAIAAPQLPVHVEAIIEGEGDIRRTAEGAFFGQARIASPTGRVSQLGAPPMENAEDALLTYRDLEISAALEGDLVRGSLQSLLNDSGRVEGQVAVANLLGPSPTLNGSARLTVPDLSGVEVFVPQLASVGGHAEATLSVFGTVAHPEITGEVSLRQLTAEVPQVGIQLRDGEVQASMSQGGAITLAGRVTSGDGQITLNGTTSEEGTLNVSVEGKNVLAANIPGAHVIIAPDVDLVRTRERMTVGGTVTIVRADVDLSKLPRTGNVQRASPDVVVIDDPEDDAVENSRRTPLEARVNVVLGESVHLAGFGLDASVSGRLLVTEVQDEPTTASGELRVSGTYKAYGQDLTIEQGRLLFAGQAITDPQLNLTATRRVDTVTAKLIVTGSAQKPLLEVSSDPPMPQTQALSYLVTGKPLNEVGQREGDLVQSAARSLGGAAGNFLAKGLGRRLGIDQIGIEESAEIGGSAFTIGQYLSPRLYLSYGVGLFEPGEVVTLRYRISDRISLEAIQGTLSQRAGINFRLER